MPNPKKASDEETRTLYLKLSHTDLLAGTDFQRAQHGFLGQAGVLLALMLVYQLVYQLRDHSGCFAATATFLPWSWPWGSP